MKVWIGKILFYAKKFKNTNKECDILLKSKECLSFISEMPDNYRKYMMFDNDLNKWNLSIFYKFSLKINMKKNFYLNCNYDLY